MLLKEWHKYFSVSVMCEYYFYFGARKSLSDWAINWVISENRLSLCFIVSLPSICCIVTSKHKWLKNLGMILHVDKTQLAVR